MIPPARLRPVSRLRVLVGALALLASLGSVVVVVEYLRHPLTVPPVEELPDAADPRDEVECPLAPAVGGNDDPVPVNSNDLYDCPHVYDGLSVRYEGEVVGALLERTDGAWVQLNDDAYAGDLGPLPAHREFRGGNAGVGVHLPRELADAIVWVGGPAARGDVLAVTGVYQQSDADSGEVAVIRASAGEIVAAGDPVEHPALPDRRIAGAVFVTAAVALLLAGRRWSGRPD